MFTDLILQSQTLHKDTTGEGQTPHPLTLMSVVPKSHLEMTGKRNVSSEYMLSPRYNTSYDSPVELMMLHKYCMTAWPIIQ